MSLLKEDYMICDYIFIYVKRGQEIPLLLTELRYSRQFLKSSGYSENYRTKKTCGLTLLMTVYYPALNDF